MIVEDKEHESIDDPIEEIPEDDLGGAGVGSRGKGRGRGSGWAKGLLIQRISKEYLISDIRMSQIDPRMIRGRFEDWMVI